MTVIKRLPIHGHVSLATPFEGRALFHPFCRGGPWGPERGRDFFILSILNLMFFSGPLLQGKNLTSVRVENGTQSVAPIVSLLPLLKRENPRALSPYADGKYLRSDRA